MGNLDLELRVAMGLLVVGTELLPQRINTNTLNGCWNKYHAKFCETSRKREPVTGVDEFGFLSSSPVDMY